MILDACGDLYTRIVEPILDEFPNIHLEDLDTDITPENFPFFTQSGKGNEL